MIFLHVFVIHMCVSFGTKISTGHIENQLIQQFLDCQIILDICVLCTVNECVCANVCFFRAISCYLFLVINDVGCHGRLFVRTLVLCHCSCSISHFLSFSVPLSSAPVFSFINFQNVKRRWIRQNQRKKSLPKDCFYHSIQTFSYKYIYIRSNAVDEMFPVHTHTHSHIYFVLIQCSRQLMIDCMLYVCRYRCCFCCYCWRYSKLVSGRRRKSFFYNNSSSSSSSSINKPKKTLTIYFFASTFVVCVFFSYSVCYCLIRVTLFMLFTCYFHPQELYGYVIAF